ncbi:SDR family oxidoreductase [Paenibacillus roseipurpureus]|uniref:SDR family oxidoreductase n=1 Tax=Paenibacillus roseopurpureus TaxID=2918901 RepID=A0AA96LL41_9BACL|nr:SDR family oxidoreductase [Paenibacillus sp. MBLB1832]WNR42959.1 SDR family oxidoreductase [Paenibacillus sp. MBLB1832]
MKKLSAYIPLGLGAPGDVANAVLYLCSDEARYITGITLDVNDGQYMR